MPRTGPLTKDTQSVALGLAQIRCGASAANIATVTPVLDSDDSIGAMANTKYTSNVDHWKMESGFPMLEDITIPIREAASLECAFKEMTPINLAYAMGKDPSAGTTYASWSIAASVVNSASGTISASGMAYNSGETDRYAETFLVTITNVGVGTEACTISGLRTGVSESAVDYTATHTIQVNSTNFIDLPADFIGGSPAVGDTFHINSRAALALGGLTSPAFVRMEAFYTYPNGRNHMYIIFPRANAVSSVEIDLQAEDAANVPLTFEAKRADSDTTGGNAAWDNMPLGVIIFD